MIVYFSTKSKKTRKQREKEKAAWITQQEKYKAAPVPKRSKAYTGLISLSKLELNSHRLTKHIPSKDSGIGNCVKKEQKVYTGDKLIGIGSLHKSNLVPVFKEDEAKDLASMRR